MAASPIQAQPLVEADGGAGMGAALPLAPSSIPAPTEDASPASAPQPGNGYASPELETAITLAQASHPSIAAARASARASGAELRGARWQRFPSLSVEGLLIDQTNNSTQATAVVDQPLWTGGRINQTIKRATHLEKAALARYDETSLEIEAGVVDAYYDVQRFARREALFEKSLAQHSEMVRTMERRVAQEVSPLSDLDLARARMMQVTQQLSQTRSLRLTAIQRLRELVGDSTYLVGAALPDPVTWPDVTIDAAIDAALAFNPRRQRVQQEALAAKAAANVSRAAILPQLSGQYSYNELYGHRVGVVLKTQTDGGLSRFASAQAARLRQQSSELLVQSVDRDIRDQIVSLQVEYQSSRDRMTSARGAAVSAQRVNESYMRQFISGRRTWLDVMNAVREATSFEIDAVDAHVGALSSLALIQLRTGQWRPEAR